MKRVNALQLRQALGKVVASIQKTGEPVLLEKGRKPVAVLISLGDYKERFVEREAHEEREAILREMDALARPATKGRRSGVEVLRELRDGG